MICNYCGGSGTYIDHAQNCNGWESGNCGCLGELYLCETCKGTGEINETIKS